jgi:3-hydroxyacyl-CoA dehydrogenase/3a,7a,12a-trihydroxy-5b-cholest-24-enoyl-CoA hydratase
VAKGGLQLKIAEAFASGTRRASPKLRQRAMSGRARGLITAQIFAGMARAFDRERGADLDAVVRWEVGGPGEPAEVWDLVIERGHAHAARIRGEETAEPRTTISLDHPTLLELATGLLNAPQAFIAGRLNMTGDVMLAQRLVSLVQVPGSRRAATPKPS